MSTSHGSGIGFLRAFLQTLAVALLAAGTIVFLNRKNLPAPRISSSESFNEKARWIARRLSQAPSANVIVAGSSMGVNNVHGPALERALPEAKVINASSWGLSIPETCSLIRELMKSMETRLIIVPVYHGDFGLLATKDTKNEEIAQVLDGKSTALTYARHLDLWYYAKTLYEQLRRERRGRTIYDSLAFDHTGGVPLDCEQFQISHQRWNSYTQDTFSFSPAATEAIRSIAELARLATEKRAVLCVVVCPMIAEAETSIAPAARRQLWEQVRASVEGQNGIFIKLSNNTLSSRHFVDFNHLNGCGAELFTADFSTVLKDALSAVTRSSMHPPAPSPK